MKLSKNSKFSILFSLIVIFFYVFLYDTGSIFYKIGIKSNLITMILFSVISIILIGLLLYILLKVIKNNILDSKSIKENIMKAVFFTLCNIIALIILYLIPLSGIGAGFIFGYLFIGLFIINALYYLTIIAYKYVLRR